MSYTLKKMFEEAQVSPIPDWFEEIELLHPVWKEPVQPRWHQITGLNLNFTSTRTALYDEQGTGKTIIAQAFAIWQAAVGNGAVCVMPPILLGQFERSIKATFKGLTDRVKVEIYKGTRKQREKLLSRWAVEGWPGIVVMSYEIFRAEHVLFSDYQSLILDEAKVLGNHENKTYAAIEAFMGEYENKYAVVMNGTPASTNLASLYGYINFVSPNVYRSKLHFDLKHVTYKKIPVRLSLGKERQVKVIDGFRNLEELFQNLYAKARRVEKHEVLELPEKNIIPYEFDLSDAHKAAYSSFVRQKLLVFEDNTILDVTTSASLRNNSMYAVIHTDVLKLEERSAVFEAIEQIFEEADVSKNKVFLLAHYQRTVEALAEHFKDYNPAVIYGPNSSAGNEKEKNKFLEDPSCRIAIANYVSGGVGLNLQDVCHTAIAVEPTGVPGQFDQAVDRLHRSGQKNKVNVYVLLPRGTIFTKAVAVMAKRKKENAKVVSKKQLLAELLGDEAQSTDSTDEGQPSDEPFESGWQNV